MLHNEKNFIFTKMCFRISFFKILFSKKMDFVDRKEEQARSLKAIQVAEKKFIVVYGGAVWANRCSSNLSSAILMSNDEVHPDF